MFNIISAFLGILPLSWVQNLGAAIAKMIAIINPSYYKILRENLANSGFYLSATEFEPAVRTNLIETGKGLLETFKIWQLSDEKAALLVKHVHGWQQVEHALASGKGIIFLTPHLGCFEITSIYYASQHPITVLYRPPRQSWLLPHIVKGRSKGKVKLAPANASGVRLLLQALKKGEAIGILPDQNPASGEGEWAPFFGKPAYTMTLASRIAEKTQATVIMAFGKRLPAGQGYDIYLSALNNGAIATPELLNAAIEQQIKACPEQYLWRYNRYKSNLKASKKRLSQ
jgi:Kdo2-lipid IVA lauroyltransferase/acyltransferase